MACPQFKPRDPQEQNVCRYWEDGNPHYPALCQHPKGLFCKTRGLNIPPRKDSDDDGYPN